MRAALLFLFSATLSFAQGPINGTNLKLSGVPVQGAAASLARLYSLSATGVGESVTPTVAWSAIVLTGTVDTTDISGFSTLGRSLVDDVLTSDMQTTLGITAFAQTLLDDTTAAAVKTTLALENVTNTSDANKPVSTAQQTALNLKANAAAPVFSGVTATSAAAPTVASATTIAPVTSIVFVSGTTTVETITPPGAIATSGGTIVIIPTGVFATGVTGNIALASTTVVSKALHMTYDSTTLKWYPSYQ